MKYSIFDHQRVNSDTDSGVCCYNNLEPVNKNVKWEVKDSLWLRGLSGASETVVRSAERVASSGLKAL